MDELQDACAERGQICWHSSEEDGGPDVGRSLGLGNGWSLWIGEISRQTWQEAGDDAAALGGDCGTWIVLYGPKRGETIVIGKAVNGYVGEDLLTLIAANIGEASPGVLTGGA